MARRARLDPVLFSVALSSWMAGEGLTQREASERLGVPQSRISQWVNRDALPSPALADRILPLIGADANSLAPRADGTPDALDVIERIVLIPRDGLVGGAGNGRGGTFPVPADDDAPDADPYPADEFRRLLGFDPSALRSAVVVGDSIRDILPPGNRVMYLPTLDIADHGLYVLDLDGARIIKLVQRLGGGALAVIPANAAYRTETFTPVDDADTDHTFRSDLSGRTATLRVVGKVVWFPTLA